MSTRHPKTPSFSSILLDEMFRSIDGNDEKFEDIKVYNEQSTRKYTNNNNGVNRVKTRRHTSSFPEMKSRSLPDNDHPMLFSKSSSSSSSNSSSNGFSSSDVEFYGSAKLRKSSSYYDQHVYKTEENLIKNNNSRDLKIPSNFKKVNQPISPGARLTNFINSLFTNGNAKKTHKNNVNDRNGGKVKSSTTNASNCSSASSFSRSCLSKTYQTDSSDKFVNNGVNRTVRLEDNNRHGRKHIAETVAEAKSRVMEKNRKIKEGSRDVFKGYLQESKKDYFMKERVIYKNGGRYEAEDDDDAASDASSDLFEIDHLALCRDKRFCDELPVYKTTHLDRNRPIARGLMC